MFATCISALKISSKSLWRLGLRSFHITLGRDGSQTRTYLRTGETLEACTHDYYSCAAGGGCHPVLSYHATTGGAES